MSERLTDEQLHQLPDDYAVLREDKLVLNGVAHELLALRARVAKLEAALTKAREPFATNARLYKPLLDTIDAALKDAPQ